MKMLLAGALGVCTSLLLACGTNSKLIPSGNAGPLQGDFDAVASAVSSGDCAGASSALQKAQSDLSALPGGTDPGLRKNLQDGVDTLARRAPMQCTQSTQSTASTTPSTDTSTTPTTTTQSTTTDTTTATTTTDSTRTKSTDTTTTSTSAPTTTDTTSAPNGGTPPGLNGGGAGDGGGNGGGGGGQ